MRINFLIFVISFEKMAPEARDRSAKRARLISDRINERKMKHHQMY
ncbi:hypothetical protein GCM10010954_29510 [Halobacillus andaensis]|uniref:Uncharacterized protein n=1 Tax=Halobacillus andaensis TaxID=1176239 RepID=A0A917B8G0_HALAA|nr:hypothetical protein [Halobacillus andaensis]MBP2005056.1 hypothetical protein [Halobacillus andaensis]GGF28549.1 hypothetical protein GCM10010954_29510 [Halobacillus andaensis]